MPLNCSSCVFHSAYMDIRQEYIIYRIQYVTSNTHENQRAPTNMQKRKFKPNHTLSMTSMYLHKVLERFCFSSISIHSHIQSQPAKGYGILSKNSFARSYISKDVLIIEQVPNKQRSYAYICAEGGEDQRESEKNVLRKKLFMFCCEKNIDNKMVLCCDKILCVFANFFFPL